METSMMSSMVAKFESLMIWVNTFDGVNCESFEDLTSGKVLLNCLQMIMPDIKVTPNNDPWKELFAIFEEFCGCSLEKAVSAEEIRSGNQEHMSRVIVLLLSVAVQSKNNESIIAAIMSLAYEVQRDIMFFIESTLAQVKSHAIVAGTFTSGVGEQLPNLANQLPVPSGESPSPSSEDSTDNNADVPLLAREPSDEVLPFPTPRRPVRALQPANFYNGLNSTAGAKLLMSPAITGHRTFKQPHYCLESPPLFSMTEVAQKQQNTSKDTDMEEISRLKHGIRVLEGTLRMEKKLAQEYYSELCTKTQDYEELKQEHCQLERKLENFQCIGDLQEELAHANMKLAAAEKSRASYKSKAESSEEWKEKASVLEREVSDLRSASVQFEDNELTVKKLENLVLESTSTQKRLELQLKTVTLEFQTQSSHLEKLLKENRKLEREVKDSKDNCSQLDVLVKEQKVQLDTKEDVEVKLIQEKRDAQLEIERFKESLLANKNEKTKLVAEMKANELVIATLKQEKEEVLKELSAKVVQLASADLQVQSLESTKSEVETELNQLQSSFQTLEQTATSRGQQLHEEIAGLASKNKFLEETREKLELQVTELQASLRTLEEEFADEKTKFSEKLSEKASTLSTKEAQLKSIECDREELETRLTQFQSKCTTLEEAIAARDAQLTSKQSEVDSLEKGRREMEAQITELNSSKHALEEAIAARDAQLTSKQSEVDSLEKGMREMEAQNTELHSSKHALEEAIAARDAQLTSKQSEVDSLEKGRREMEAQITELNSSKHALEEAIAARDAQLTSKQSEVDSLEKGRREMEAQITELCSSKHTLEEAIAARDVQLTSKQSEVDSLEKGRREMEAQITKLCSSKHTLEEAIAARDAQLTSKQSEVDSLEKGRREMEAQITELNSSKHALEEAIAARDAQLSSKQSEVDSLEDSNREMETHICKLQSHNTALKEDISTKEAQLAFKQSQVDSLENDRRTLEARISQLESTSEQLVASREAEGGLRIQIETLERGKKVLEAQISQLQSGRAELEQTFGAKEVQLSLQLDSLSNDKEEIKNEIAQLESRNVALEQAVVTTSNQLHLQIDSLKDDKRKMEAEIAQLESSNRLLEHRVVSKEDELGTNRERLSSLSSQNRNLLEDMKQLRDQHRAAKAKMSEYESELELKQNSLATVREELSRQQARLSDVHRQLFPWQHNSDDSKVDVETVCAMLETRLLEHTNEGESCRATIENYTRALETKEELVDNLRTQLTEQEQKIRELSEENRSLLLTQRQLSKDITLLSEKLSHCQQLEAEYNTSPERARSSSSLTIEPMETTTRHGVNSSSSSKRDAFNEFESMSIVPPLQLPPPTTFTVSPAYSANPTASTREHHGDAVSTQLFDSAKKIPEPSPPPAASSSSEKYRAKLRIRELRQRNKQALPHLKSSYPIEMQVRPETPTTSAERLKHGGSKSKKLDTQQDTKPSLSNRSADKLQAPSRNYTPTSSPRKRARVDGGGGPSRLSVPATPQTPAVEPDYRRKTMLTTQPSGLNLRKFLDADGSSTQQQVVPSAMAFDITLSPPKTSKRTLPPRLRERRTRKQSGSNSPKEEDKIRRETTVIKNKGKKPKVEGNTSKVQNGVLQPSQKRTLRSRN